MFEANDLLTREDVMRAANRAADLVIEEMGWTDDATPERDAVNLLVNVLWASLQNPAGTVDQAMDAAYEGGAEEVRSWWPEWGQTCIGVVQVAMRLL
jgi:hypothetical protein